VKTTASVGYPLPKCRKLELSLSHTDEDQRRVVLSPLTVHVYRHAKGAKPDQNAKRGDDRGKAVAQPALHLLSGSHEGDICTDGARVEKYAAVDATDIDGSDMRTSC
jgi:hypothetical protein